MNCIQQGIIPTKYCKKSKEKLTGAEGSKLKIRYKLPKVHVCVDNICIQTFLTIVNNLDTELILGTPFISLIHPFLTTDEGLETTILGQTIRFPFIEK